MLTQSIRQIRALDLELLHGSSVEYSRQAPGAPVRSDVHSKPAESPAHFCNFYLPNFVASKDVVYLL
ncbi:unnamed protein product [Caenorhabditis auriculariae]|uniref:Uncharacterized protein n=1 Tax=Caenorhabditis auriculariae TaxID=2777116 RepID=A0A8S1GP89_9PELO|nr:unnamed protein product [Caenorhabditis auriculariae]